jgi:cytochrome c-type biogenesis protein CcsB
VTNEAWETLSNQAVAGAGVVYALALVAHSAQWASLRRLPADQEPTDERTLVFGRFGLMLTGLAAAIHLVALLGRGLAADPNRVPWGNMYEFTLSGTCVVTLVYLALYRRYSLSWMAPWVVGFVFVVLMAAVVALYEPVAPLTEALSSPWLVIHVISAILATGIFSLAGIVSVLYLVKSRSVARQPVGAGGAYPSTVPQTGLLARIPAPDDLDRLSYRLHAFAFPIWTFAVLITGPIWAHQAWSRYWGWDAKEVWAFITWVVYAAYLHARATAGWKGRNAAIVALVGLATLWFNFIGINFFFGGSSQHSYAAPAAVVQVRE